MNMVVYTLEQCWEILRHYFENYGNVAECVWQKKIIFLDEAHFDLGGYINKIDPFGIQKTRTHTLESRRTQNESLFGVYFGPEAKLGNFSLKMSKEKALQSITIVIGPC